MEITKIFKIYKDGEVIVEKHEKSSDYSIDDTFFTSVISSAKKNSYVEVFSDIRNNQHTVVLLNRDRLESVCVAWTLEMKTPLLDSTGSPIVLDKKYSGIIANPEEKIYGDDTYELTGVNGEIVLRNITRCRKHIINVDGKYQVTEEVPDVREEEITQELIDSLQLKPCTELIDSFYSK